MWISNISKTNLKMHNEGVHDGRQFQCPECKHRYSSNLVTYHKSVHIGQKFQCTECEYQATRKGHLVTHQKSTYGPKVPMS